MTLINGGIDRIADQTRDSADGRLTFQDADPIWRKATVEDVYPETHTLRVVLSIGGKTIRPEVPLMSRNFDPDSQAKEILLYKRGTPVFISRSPGYWICHGIAPIPIASYPEKGYQRKLTNTEGFGGEDPVYKNITGSKYRGQASRDAMAGDWAVQGSEGNQIAILEGGLSIFRGGELSQIIASKLGDIIKMVARNFELFTDFGEVKMLNENGKTSLVINGSSDALNTNKQNQSWDYEVKLGGDGNLFSLNLGKNAAGSSLFSFKVDPDGKATVRTDSAFVVEMDKQPELKINSDVVTEYSGVHTEKIGKNKFSRVNGNEQKDLVGQYKLFVGTNLVTSVSNNELKTVTHTSEEKINGLSATDTNTDAKRTTVSSGDFTVSIGDPKDLGVPCPALGGKMGSYNLKVWIGDINREVKLKGNILDKVQVGSKIELMAGLGKIKLDGLGLGTVAIGNSSAELLDLFDQFLDAYLSSTYSGFGAPASPTTLATVTTIKANLGLIKGSL